MHRPALIALVALAFTLGACAKSESADKVRTTHIADELTPATIGALSDVNGREECSEDCQVEDDSSPPSNAVGNP